MVSPIKAMPSVLRVPLPRLHRRLPSMREIRQSHICNSTDYVATPSDEGVLRLNPRTDLTAEEITNVFGYPRDLKGKVRMQGVSPD